jgi:uncharacterized CHY-type Zn-finger protein
VFILGFPVLGIEFDGSTLYIDMSVLRPTVLGVDLDPETRCAHYRSSLDIIAIKTKCCGVYYACKDCHEALANHSLDVWPASDWDQTAVLCGVCGSELSVVEYMECGNECPSCKAKFNPGCRNHYHFYFEQPSK